MERFSSCWGDEDKPYLLALPDTPGHEPEATAFCDTRDKDILGQVLNNYDQETTDFYRWSVIYEREELSELIKRKSGMDIGVLQYLEPVLRGDSGRIVKLRIVGSMAEVILGKELEIRRVLSDSHLKSSAFDVRYLTADGEETAPESGRERIMIDGKGWGHGVGLCQIGAAVMASKGYTYTDILKHYYPNSELK